MKIAIVSNTTFNIFNFRLGLILFLQSKGYEVVYLSPFDSYVEKMKGETNAKFIPLKQLSRKGYNPFKEILLLKELYRIFRKENIDLAITYTIKPNIYSAIAAHYSKTKIILNITGLGFAFLKKSIGNTIAISLLKRSMRYADVVVFQNQTDRKLFVMKEICPAKKATMINGSGINTDRYLPSHSTKTNTGFVFLFIGRLLYDKGIYEFIEAAKKLNSLYPEIKFQMLGSLDKGNRSAVSEEELFIWLEENLQLEFLDHQKDVKPYIQNCDAVVLPSYREGIPRVLLEAMALEKPFITSDSAGCKDVTVDGKNGFLSATASADSLFDAMKKMYSLPEEERKQMGRFGRALVMEKYDEKIIVQDYLKLILRLTT